MTTEPMKSTPGTKQIDPASTAAAASKSKKKLSEQEVDPDQKGCATSFIMEERGEIGGICDVEPNPTEEYVQPDKEKEAGGEG